MHNALKEAFQPATTDRDVRLVLNKLINFLFRQIKIILTESTLENWGIRGGQAACDVDLGFQLNL